MPNRNSDQTLFCLRTKTVQISTCHMYHYITCIITSHVSSHANRAQSSVEYYIPGVANKSIAIDRSIAECQLVDRA